MAPGRAATGCRVLLLANNEVFRGGCVVSCVRVRTDIRAHPLCWKGAPVLGVTSDVRAAVPEQCPGTALQRPSAVPRISRRNPVYVSVLGCVGAGGVLA